MNFYINFSLSIIPVRVSEPARNTELYTNVEFNFRKANYTELNSNLQSTDWTITLATGNGDVNEVKL